MSKIVENPKDPPSIWGPPKSSRRAKNRSKIVENPKDPGVPGSLGFSTIFDLFWHPPELFPGPHRRGTKTRTPHVVGGREHRGRQFLWVPATRAGGPTKSEFVSLRDPNTPSACGSSLDVARAVRTSRVRVSHSQSLRSCSGLTLTRKFVASEDKKWSILAIP